MLDIVGMTRISTWTVVPLLHSFELILSMILLKYLVTLYLLSITTISNYSWHESILNDFPSMTYTLMDPLFLIFDSWFLLLTW